MQVFKGNTAQALAHDFYFRDGPQRAEVREYILNNKDFFVKESGRLLTRVTSAHTKAEGKTRAALLSYKSSAASPKKSANQL